MEFADNDTSSRITLDDGTILTLCDQCRQMWQERNQRGVEGKPPCETCKVELLPENEDVARVYLLTRRQYVTAEQGRVVDVSIPAIKTVMDLHNVTNQKDCLLRVIKAFHHFEAERQKGAT